MALGPVDCRQGCQVPKKSKVPNCPQMVSKGQILKYEKTIYNLKNGVNFSTLKKPKNVNKKVTKLYF